MPYLIVIFYTQYIIYKIVMAIVTLPTQPLKQSSKIIHIPVEYLAYHLCPMHR